MRSKTTPPGTSHTIMIRHRLQEIAREKSGARQRAMAEAMAFEWARRDINLAWNETSRSRLDPAIRQVIFNMLWS